MLRNYRLKNYNFKLIINVLVLGIMGLIFIHSADASYVSKQAMGLIMGLIVMVIVSLIDFQIFTKNAVPLYVINMILLIGVRLFGKEVNNAKRWFSLGPLGTFQPSELTKIIMIIVVTAFLMRHEDDLNKPKTLGKLILICAPPLYMILQQPNLSTTLDICFIVVAMVFVAGLDSKLIVRVSCDWNCQLYGISVFYQYRRCDRRYAEYGASASVYQLWLKFRFVGVHMYRTAVKY